MTDEMMNLRGGYGGYGTALLNPRIGRCRPASEALAVRRGGGKSSRKPLITNRRAGKCADRGRFGRCLRRRPPRGPESRTSALHAQPPHAPRTLPLIPSKAPGCNSQ